MGRLLVALGLLAVAGCTTTKPYQRELLAKPAMAVERDPERLALEAHVIAIQEGRPSHRPFWIRGLDGVHRFIEVTAFPLIRQDGRSAGAVALFWEVGSR